MNHLRVSIILLLLILVVSFLSFFNCSSIQEGYTDINKGANSITIRQISILNNLLSDFDCTNATKILNGIRGMKMNNPHFDIIMHDRNLSDYGKLVMLKETLDYVSLKSMVLKNKTKNSINQPIISNSDETIKDEITIENVVLIKDIIDGTDLQNAESSIETISKLDLKNSIVKPLLEINTLSSYNRILFIKYIIERIVTDSSVTPDEMDKTWKQFVFNPTNPKSDSTGPSPTSTPTSLSSTSLSSSITSSSITSAAPYILNGLTAGKGPQFPSISGKSTLYIIGGTGTLTITSGMNISCIFLVGGGAGGSSKGSPGLGGSVMNQEVSVSPKANETYILNISIGNGGAAENNGTDTTCSCSALDMNYVAKGGVSQKSGNIIEKFGNLGDISKSAGDVSQYAGAGVGAAAGAAAGASGAAGAGVGASAGDVTGSGSGVVAGSGDVPNSLPSASSITGTGANPGAGGTQFTNGNSLYYGGPGGSESTSKNAPLGGGGGGGSAGGAGGNGGGISDSMSGGNGGSNGAAGSSSNYGGGGGGGNSDGKSGGDGGSGTGSSVGGGGKGSNGVGGGGNGGYNTGGGGGAGGSGGSGGSGIVIIVF